MAEKILKEEDALFISTLVHKKSPVSSVDFSPTGSHITKIQLPTKFTHLDLTQTS